MESLGTGYNTDHSWNSFYKVGGLSAILYVFLGIIIPAIMVLVTSYDFHMQSADLLNYIATHTFFWLTLQTLVLGSSILAIITFVALYIALKHLNKSYSLLGTVITISCQILFIAYYPILLGLVNLSNRYETASYIQGESIISAAEALISINNAFNPLYESIFAIGILILSLVMLKGLFHRYIAYLGIVIGPAAIIALSLWPLLGVAYFWWWLLFVVWFTAVGLKLYKLGMK